MHALLFFFYKVIQWTGLDVFGGLHAGHPSCAAV